MRQTRAKTSRILAARGTGKTNAGLATSPIACRALSQTNPQITKQPPTNSAPVRCHPGCFVTREVTTRPRPKAQNVYYEKTGALGGAHGLDQIQHRWMLHLPARTSRVRTTLRRTK